MFRHVYLVHRSGTIYLGSVPKSRQRIAGAVLELIKLAFPKLMVVQSTAALHSWELAKYQEKAKGQ